MELRGNWVPRRQRRIVWGTLETGLVAALLLAGCSSVPDAINPAEWYRGIESAVSGDDGADANEAAGAEADPDAAAYAPPEEIPGADKPFPNLGDVPSRPVTSTAEERERLTEGLVADRERRQYSNEVITLQGPSKAMPGTNTQPPLPPSLSPVPSVGSTPVPAPASVQASASSTAATPEPPPPPPTIAAAPPPEPTFSVPESVPTVASKGASAKPAESEIPSPSEQFMRAARSTSAEVEAQREIGTKAASVLFVEGSSNFGEGAADALLEIATRHRQYGGTVRVIGYGGKPSNASGAASSGGALGRARAETVVGELVRLGVPEGSIRIDAAGTGGALPDAGVTEDRADIFFVR